VRLIIKINFKRTTIDLSGQWEFTFLGDLDPESVQPEQIVFDGTMSVPGCFDVAKPYALKRGLTAYRRLITLHDARRHRLVFDSVNFWCRVYIGDRQIGEHSGGYSRFAMDIVEEPAGEAELVVLVDNRFDAERNPLHYEEYDWYQYGGITRAVRLHVLPDIRIDAVRATTVAIDPPAIQVEIDVACDSSVKMASLSVAFDGQVVVAKTIEPSDSQTLAYQFTVEDASLWSLQNPALYELCVTLGDDTVSQRVGVRQVRANGKEILINDEPIRLLGVCWHEAHPKFGCAIPTELMEADLQQIHGMGCNFIRGTHYPFDERLLERCDELGICVMSESVGWNNEPEHLMDPAFLYYQKQQIGEMIAAAHNHPCVVIWGLLNEGPSNHVDTRPVYKELMQHIRQLDPSRPVTYASNRVFESDRCLNLVDIVSINTYPGWYVGELDEIPAELDRVVERLEADGVAEKPLLISEIGAGALMGWDDGLNQRWTESYQAELLKTAITHLFETRGDVAGLAIWQFSDCRTTTHIETTLKRPRGYNNKGIVDEYRNPKLAYKMVRSLYRRLGESLRALRHH